MRLLFILQNFPPSVFGGIANSMFPIVDELNKSSHEIKVLTTNYKLPNGKHITYEWTKYEGITVNYIKTRFPAFSFGLILEGFHQIKQADQVHLSSIFYFPNFLFAIFSILNGKHVILSPHGELQGPALRYKSWKKKPYLFILTLFLKKCKFRATSSEEFMQIQNYFPKSKIFIVPNFFIFNAPINENKINQFLFLGRICPIKKLENLILACLITNLFQSSNFKLVLAGPIDKEFLGYKKTLDDLIVANNLTEKIIFLGEINSPNKEKLLSQSKALFLVSQSENFGNVVLESLAQGTPVVGSKGTPWQSLEQYDCGYWIDNSPEAISFKMDELILMNNDNYKKMSQNALLLSNEFTKNKIMPKWEKLINEISYV